MKHKDNSNDQSKAIDQNATTDSQEVVITSIEDSPIATSKSINLHRPSNDSLALFNGKDELMEFVDEIIKSKFAGTNTSRADVLIVMQKAKELGVGWANALDHFYFINNKTATGFHIFNALVLKPSNNIYFEIIKDAEPVYTYTYRDPDTDKVIEGVTREELPSTAQIVKPSDTKATNDAIKLDGKIPCIERQEVVASFSLNGKTQQILNKETIIKFTRIKKVAGKDVTLTITHKFSIKEAWAAGVFVNKEGELLLDKPWFRYQDNQLYIRCFTLGSRRIADDIMLGLYEVTELLDSEGRMYTYDKQGNIIIND